MWQGEITPGPIPSLRDIQASIVRFGDKPKSFIGSCQWIGSLEVCIVDVLMLCYANYVVSFYSELSSL